MTRNYKFTVAYDGTRFYGWEHQPNTDMTIQGKLENVLSLMTETTVEVLGAGRRKQLFAMLLIRPEIQILYWSICKLIILRIYLFRYPC